MKYDKIKNYKNEEFRRLSGIKKATFARMIAILNEAEQKKKAIGGKPGPTHENKLLLI